MGYFFATAPCFACRQLVTFNPNLVPSHDNQPICRTCVERVNPLRIENGLDPITILPGAYNPAPEGELR